MSAVSLDRPEVISGRFETAMPEDEYFAHPALSASGMKTLLRSPKHFRFARTENEKPKAIFDVGHAVHCKVLGRGMPVVEIPARLLSGVNMAISSNAAKEWVETARAEGKVPIKPADYLAVMKMSDALLKNEKAKRVLEAAPYREVSLFAKDEATGVQMRGRIDALGDLLGDVKTIEDASTRKVTTAVVDLGYDVSAAVYRELVRLVLGYDPGPMHLMFVEKKPPYDSRVVRLAGGWEITGEAKMRGALDLFAWCTEQGAWPGDDEDGGEIHDLPVPAWYERQLNVLEEDAL
jgi:hypothetical protein